MNAPESVFQRKTVVSFEVPGEPKGKGRHRSAPLMRGGKPVIGQGGRPIVTQFTPTATRNYEARVATFAKQAMRDLAPTDRPVYLKLTVFVPIAASWSKKKKAAAIDGSLAPAAKPDLDNIEKAIKDGCNGIVWADDCQVVECSKRKLYGDVPGVRVQVMTTGQASPRDF